MDVLPAKALVAENIGDRITERDPHGPTSASANDLDMCGKTVEFISG
jgi:hypothetical protein